MSDNSFCVLNASGNTLEAALHIVRSLDGDGASCDDARRMLSDLSTTAELLTGAISRLQNIANAFVGSRQLPEPKSTKPFRI